MHHYTKLIFLISFTLATPLFTTRWPQAYKCDFNSIMPRCCINACKIIPTVHNKVCIVEDKSQGEPHRFSILIDEFPTCSVYRSGNCIYDAEICVRVGKNVYVCHTSISLIFKHHAAEWCFSSYIKVFGVKMYKYSKLCTYFAENYFLLPRYVEDLLISAGY